MTTTGRTSGKPRTVELWFVFEDWTLHVLAGGGTGAHWVRNVQNDPAVAIRLGQRTYAGRARFPERGGAEDEFARRRIAAKYQGWREGRPLSAWARDSLGVAFDLEREL